MTTTSHEPTPEFARFLEWQVTTAVRRQARFAEPPRPAYVKYLGMAALVVVSVLIGAGGVTAAGRIQANEQTRMLLAQQAGEVLVAQMQVDVAKQAVELARRQTEVGTAPKETYAAAERDLRLATLTLKKASLKSEEIGASGKPVQDDLAAPLVGRRDFVAERLRLDHESAGVAYAAAAERLKLVTTRFAVGLAGEMEVADAQGGMTRATVEASEIASLIEMRLQFLAGKVKATDMTHRRLITATRAQLTIAESDLVAATKRYALVQTRFEVGTATEVELLKTRLEMVSKQQDIEQLKARIRTLEGR